MIHGPRQNGNPVKLLHYLLVVLYAYGVVHHSTDSMTEILVGAELAAQAQALADEGLTEGEAAIACGYFSEKDGQRRPAILRFLRGLMQAGVSVAFTSKRATPQYDNHVRVTKLGQLVVGPRFTRAVSGYGDLYEITHTEDFGQIVLTKVRPDVAAEMIDAGKVRKQRKAKATEPAAEEPALVA